MGAARHPRTAARAAQRALFDELPDGFHYRAEFVAVEEEAALLAELGRIPLASVEMRGGVARRRTAHFGWTYGYEARTSEPGAPIPPFLRELRARAAEWLGVDAQALAEALVTQYPPGAPIGWHRDAPMFGEVAGISLGSACRMQFRRYVAPRDRGTPGRGPRRTTHELVLAPRSAYLITGVSRREFEHHIPPVAHARYSITFRTMVGRGKRRGAPAGPTSTDFGGSLPTPPR
jgi:alkylated DNA repair dioxygenase AlkB